MASSLLEGKPTGNESANNSLARNFCKCIAWSAGTVMTKQFCAVHRKLSSTPTQRTCHPLYDFFQQGWLNCIRFLYPIQFSLASCRYRQALPRSGILASEARFRVVWLLRRCSISFWRLNQLYSLPHPDLFREFCAQHPVER